MSKPAPGEPKDERATPEQPRGPKRWGRCLVSALVALHLLAIVSAVTSAPTPTAPAPLPALQVNEVFRPYLQATFLTNPYRFYAPDPGATNIFWVRLQYHDGTVRWYVIPDRNEYTFRMPYQRHLSVTMLLAPYLVPNPQNPSVRPMGRDGKPILRSYVRHIAETYARDGNPVERVELYDVQHWPLRPEAVRLGWEQNDLRSFDPWYYGEFRPNGSWAVAPDGRFMNDDEWLYQQQLPMSAVVVRMLQADIYPILNQQPYANRFDVIADEAPAPEGAPGQTVPGLNIPAPVREVLIRYPYLLDPQLAQRTAEKLKTNPDLKIWLVQQMVLDPRVRNWLVAGFRTDPRLERWLIAGEPLAPELRDLIVAQAQADPQLEDWFTIALLRWEVVQAVESGDNHTYKQELQRRGQYTPANW
jgi:hypothetical protein